MALLPRALHAASLTFLGDHWFVTLRTQIMRALRFDRAGASPLIRIALVCGLDVDPAYRVGWQTFHDVVFYLHRNAYVRLQWCRFVNCASARTTHGPFANFLKTLG